LGPGKPRTHLPFRNLGSNKRIYQPITVTASFTERYVSFLDLDLVVYRKMPWKGATATRMKNVHNYSTYEYLYYDCRVEVKSRWAIGIPVE
jgi:hypothetical protein